jgi:hypothetical protein
VIQITQANEQECDRALIALRDHLDDLARMTEKYPVECGFGGYRFVFTSKADIISLIDALDDKLKRYRAAA